MTSTALHNPTSHHQRTEVPWANELVLVAQQARSFQTRELLQHIVSGEQQRIREEQMLWRVGGAILGACLGLGDGFQAADVFLGMGLSSLGGLTHEVMSDEDRRFLERCQSLWTVGCNSPLELLHRLGPARARILLYSPEWSQPILCAHHQGHRGDTLVLLDSAGQLAAGFQQPQSLEVMQRHLNHEQLEALKHQLYPNAGVTIPLDAIQPISSQQALALDPCAQAFLPATQPVQIAVQGQPLVGYRVAIPAHSDF